MPKKKQTKHTVRRHKLNLFPVIFWLILLVLAGAVIHGGYKFLFDKSYDLPDLPVTTADTQTTSQSSIQTKAQSDSSNTEDAEEQPDNKTPKQYDGEDANASEALTGVVTYSAFSGGKLIIRTNIDQYLGSGICTITLADGDHSLEHTTSIIPEASTSTCEGFDVPESELTDFERPITVNIYLASGDRSGVIIGRVN